MNLKKIFIFKEKSLKTITLGEFNSLYDGLDFIFENDIYKNSFAYEYLNSNNRLSTKVAYGLFSSKDAKVELEEFNTTKNKSIENSLTVLKRLNRPKIVTKNIVKTSKVKVALVKKEFETDEAFKKKFLETNYNKFTINLATFKDINTAGNFVNENNISKESFVFKFGDNGEWTKVMYGVFNSYGDAKISLLNIQEKFKETNSDIIPLIEKIGKKQDLYDTYKDDLNISEEIDFSNYREVILETNTTIKENGNFVKDLDDVIVEPIIVVENTKTQDTNTTLNDEIMIEKEIEPKLEELETTSLIVETNENKVIEEKDVDKLEVVQETVSQVFDESEKVNVNEKQEKIYLKM